MSLLFPENDGDSRSLQEAAQRAARFAGRGDEPDPKRHEDAIEQGRQAALAMSSAEVAARIRQLEEAPELLSRPQGHEARQVHARICAELDCLSVAQDRHRRPEPDAREQLFEKFLMSHPERDVGAGAEVFGAGASARQLSTRVLATHGREGFDAYQTARRDLRAAERSERPELDRLMAARASGMATAEQNQDLADLEQRLEGPRAKVREFETTAGASFEGQPLAGGDAVADNGDLFVG